LWQIHQFAIALLILVKRVREETIEACLARMRAILMTTLTTILGLIPMMLFGGYLWYPMSVVIIFGLAIGTILTLGFVPVLYVIFFKDL
jgi:multidrug efflux pump subunit AcrB